MNKIQLDFGLFIDICGYFLRDDTQLASGIREQLQEKCDRLISRELFSRYKRTATSAEREAARREYLDHRGILPDFRTSDEVPTDKL